MNRVFVLSLFIIFILCSCIQRNDNDSTARGFRASVVKKNITPVNSQNLLGYQARKSTGVHDSIYHRILALDDGTTQFFLISTEICVLSPVEYDRVAAKIENQLGISPMNLWWTTSHTHSAPEVGKTGLDRVFLGERFEHEVDAEYTAFVVDKLMEGIKESIENLLPARLGVGWGFSRANINRRAKGADGKAFIGFNPDGPIDNKIGVLRVEHEDGYPIALVANYPIHPTVLGSANLEISGDVTGIVSEYVEQKIGAPLLFINGAAGDLSPVYSFLPYPRSGELAKFRVLLGDKILKANKNISSTTDKVTLNPGSLIVETPRRHDLEWPSDFDNYTRTAEEGEFMVKLPIRFLEINENIAIWGAPLELFCEIAIDIRNRSPVPYTFYFGYTNGWFGYMLTESEYLYGGYEPSVSPFTPRASADLTEAVLTYFQEKSSSTEVHK